MARTIMIVVTALVLTLIQGMSAFGDSSAVDSDVSLGAIAGSAKDLPNAILEPVNIRWPEYVETFDTRSFEESLTNYEDTAISVTIVDEEISPASDWMSVVNAGFSMAPGERVFFEVVVTAPAGGPQFLDGTVWIHFAGVEQTIAIHVHLWSANEIAEPNIYDTAATSPDWNKGPGDYVAITASNHGEMGHRGLGRVNLDFVQSGADCDSSAVVYLFSGSPFVLIKRGATVDGTTSHYNESVGSGSPMTFVPLPDALISSGLGSRSGIDFDSLFIGRMANRDSTVWLERTFYAPRNLLMNRSFVAVRTVLGTEADVTDSLMIGDIIDWDVPSVPDQISSSTNTAGILSSADHPYVYVRGTDTSGSNLCVSNTRRFASEVFDFAYNKHGILPDSIQQVDHPWNSWITPVRDTGAAAPTGLFDIDTATNDFQYNLWWDSLRSITGWLATGLNRDLGQFITYDVRDGLRATDTMVYWTILATGYDIEDESEFDLVLDDAKSFVYEISRLPCCTGLRGDIDGIGGDAPNLADLSEMIYLLFISLSDFRCYEEANVDASQPEGYGSVTLSDLSALIDVLFISLEPPPPCP